MTGKRLKFILYGWLISIFIAASPSNLQAGPLTMQSSSLYFSFRVDHYKVQMETAVEGYPQATITLTLGKGKGTVMSDRPYRQERDTTMGDFLAYLHKKPMLNLSLQVTPPHTKQMSILNFEVKNVDYQKGQETVTFKAHLLDSPGYQVLAAPNTENKEITGQHSMLFVDG